MPRRKQTRAKPKNAENEDPDKSIAADSSNDAALRKEGFMRDFRIQGFYTELFHNSFYFDLVLI